MSVLALLQSRGETSPQGSPRSQNPSFLVSGYPTSVAHGSVLKSQTDFTAAFPSQAMRAFHRSLLGSSWTLCLSFFERGTPFVVQADLELSLLRRLFIYLQLFWDACQTSIMKFDFASKLKLGETVM